MHTTKAGVTSLRSDENIKIPPILWMFCLLQLVDRQHNCLGGECDHTFQLTGLRSLAAVATVQVDHRNVCFSIDFVSGIAEAISFAMSLDATPDLQVAIGSVLSAVLSA